MRRLGLAHCATGFLLLAGLTPAYSAVLFQETFADNSQEWILGATWNIGPTLPGQFQIPLSFPDPEFDHTPTDDNQVAGVILGGNPPTTLHPFYYIWSPIIPVPTGTAYLEFWRWLNSDIPPFMHSTLEVFDGAVWVNLFSVGGTAVYDNSWTYQQFDISSMANPQFQIRFGYDIAQPGVFEVSSWNIDDVAICDSLDGGRCVGGTSAVPEPGGLGMAGVAFTVIVGSRRFLKAS